MTEDEGDLGIPHFVADNISRWYPVEPKKINCAMLQKENKSLASSIPDIGEQMQMIEQMLRDFYQKYARINNPQSKVETQIDEFLTGVRNASNMGSAEKLQLAAPSPGAQPASGRQSPAFHKLTITTRPPSHLPPHTPAPCCCATHPF